MPLNLFSVLINDLILLFFGINKYIKYSDVLSLRVSPL